MVIFAFSSSEGNVLPVLPTICKTALSPSSFLVSCLLLVSMDSDLCSQHLSPKGGGGNEGGSGPEAGGGGGEEGLDQFCTHPLTQPLETLPGGVGDLLVPNTSHFLFLWGRDVKELQKK